MRLRSQTASRLAPLLLGIGALLPLSAEAQSISSPYRFFDTRHEFALLAGVAGENRGDLRLGPGGGPIVGLRYGFELTETLALEGGAFYLKTDREVYDPSDPNTAPALVAIADQHVTLFEARARLNLTGPRTWYTLAPFLSGGAGLALGTSEVTAEEQEMVGSGFVFGPSLTGSVGAGIRWLPGTRFGARIEGTVNLWKLGNPPSFRALTEVLGPVPESAWARWMALTVGASYRF